MFSFLHIFSNLMFLPLLGGMLYLKEILRVRNLSVVFNNLIFPLIGYQLTYVVFLTIEV